MTYKQLEEAIRIWAEDQEIVRALAVIGSRARADHAADAWSDLDFIFFVTDLQEIAQDSSWLNTFGQVVLKVLQRTGAGDPEWLVLYGGGLKVDFVLAVAKRSFPEDLFGPRFGIVSRRGARILVDKENARPEQFSVEFAGCLGFYTLRVAADVVCGQPPITKREASGKFGYRWGEKIRWFCDQQAG